MTYEEKIEKFFKAYPDYKPEEPVCVYTPEEAKRVRDAIEEQRPKTKAEKEAFLARLRASVVVG